MKFLLVLGLSCVVYSMECGLIPTFLSRLQISDSATLYFVLLPLFFGFLSDCLAVGRIQPVPACSWDVRLVTCFVGGWVGIVPPRRISPRWSYLSSPTSEVRFGRRLRCSRLPVLQGCFFGVGLDYSSSLLEMTLVVLITYNWIAEVMSLV